MYDTLLHLLYGADDVNNTSAVIIVIINAEARLVEMVK